MMYICKTASRQNRTANSGQSSAQAYRVVAICSPGLAAISLADNLLRKIGVEAHFFTQSRTEKLIQEKKERELET
jgi:hypothetical protein